MKENKLNSLEQKLNEKLNEASFEFQESHWAAMEGKLANKGGFLSGYKWVKIAAVLLISAVGTYYLFDKEDSKLEKDIIIENTLIKEKSNTQQKLKSSIEAKEKPNTEKSNISNNIPKKLERQSKKESVNQVDSELSIELTETADQTIEAKVDEEILFSDVDASEVLIEELIIDGNLCIGNKISITAISNIKDLEDLIWKVNDVIVDNSFNEFRLNIEKYGQYKVEVISSSGSSQSAIFEVFNSPEINFTYEDLSDPFWDEVAILKAEPFLGNYKWEIEGMENPILGNNQTVDFSRSGFFDIELIYTDLNGCETSVSKPIQIQENFDPLAPTAFTPDGDGLNDDFMPHGFNNLDANFRMSIYDIKGNLVYLTTSLNEPWKGEKIIKNSELSPNFYVWKVEISKDNRTKAFTGQVQQYNSFE